MTEVTNKTDGPRAVHTIAGEVYFGKGETKNVEFAPGGITAARMIGLDVDGEEPDADAPATDISAALESARREVAEAAQAEMDRRDTKNAERLAAANDRADKAEQAYADALIVIDELKVKLAALDLDGDGNPGGSRQSLPPSLSNKTKAELIEIAKAEGVEIEDGATNDDIKSAIELHREG